MKLYCAVSGSVTITQNNYYAFYITNPSGSGITAQFDLLEFTTKQLLDVVISKDVTGFTDTGTLTPTNFNAGFSDNSAMTVEIASNVSTNPVSGGTSIYEHLADINFDIDYEGGITLPPGHNNVIRIQNQGATGAATFNMMWWEFAT